MAFRHASAEQALALIENNAVVADIRDAHSFAAGHIPGSVHLSNDNLHQFTLDQDMDKPLIVVCYHGISSQGAANYLAELGFDEVYSLDGGFELWQREHPEQVADNE